MRSAPVVAAVVLGFCAQAAAAAAPSPPLAPEHLTVEKLPPKNPHWLYVFDAAFDNEIDYRIHLYDGDTYRRLGMEPFKNVAYQEQLNAAHHG